MRLALLVVSLLIVPAIAHARVDHGLDLGRIAAHECGLDCSADEVAAIAAVALARCEGCSISTAVRTYSRRFFAGTTSRSYYLALDREGRAPSTWPAAASWSRFRDRWFALLAIADAVVAGEIVAACSAEAWGGSIDAARARRLRLIEVDCGATRNRFYTYPRRRS